MSVDFVKWNLRSTLARFCGVLARSPLQMHLPRREWFKVRKDEQQASTWFQQLVHRQEDNFRTIQA